MTGLSLKLAIRLSDAVITEIIDPSFEDPIKLRYSKIRLPLALRFIDVKKFNIIKQITDRFYDIGFVGRLEREKGIDLLIPALKSLYKEGLMPRVVIVGDGSLRNIVEASLSNLHVDVMSYVPHEKLPYIYNKMKIIILPSRKEGVPTVLLEALACGVIPVASRVGGIPWLIRKANTGILLDDLSYHSIAKALKYLLGLDVMRLKEMSQNGRNFIEKFLVLEEAVRRYSLIKKVLKYIP
ncbi:glycosyltransferase family 4 protein [Infirmifilum sp. NZ]|uniref:glycosyltransferase family 4 protein n=1 Tax=Infirmifilum sp. NZ TaxID=2926850 RepID=UPI00279E8DBE|nr:glycosyltransferase family 4 protein [Infirmifilum sp. NZ]UNQ73155.1 glycosyltransferase family 4 protein [Infirmifilum sp. NZ]